MLKRLKLQTQLDAQDLNLQELTRELPNSHNQFCSQPQQGSAKVVSNHRKKESDHQAPKFKRTSLQNRIHPEFSAQDSLKNNTLFEQTIQESTEARNIVPRRKYQSKKSKGGRFQAETNYQTEDRSDIDRFQQSGILKDIIRRYKIKSIVSNFVAKIKRVSVLQQPVEESILDEYQKNAMWKKSGFELPQLAQNIITLLGIIQIILFSFILSITFVYPQLQENGYVTDFETFTLLVLLMEIFVNLTTVKYHSGKKIKALFEIWQFYLKGYLVVDLLGVIVLLCNILTSSPHLNYLKVLILFKIPQCIDKMEKLQVYFIKNLYNEQYWSLVKILLFNFSFAHIISILLTAMTYLSPGDNWMTTKGIEQSPWYEQYSWSYYWANTIMLTVGFGDLVANNYKQAFCLVFIETFSCMAFAYNINCIGSIIQQIRAKDAQRSQKSKIFTKLNDNKKLSEQLSWKINNYIEETARLRKNFNYEQQREFIANLPIQMKKEYLKQSNKNIFENIHFFKSFISKTLYNLAEKIQMRVSHPEEVIQNLYDDYNLIILKTGRLGFVYKRPNFDMKQFVVDTKEITETDNPYLVNLDFITRNKCFYEIKSMEYAIFYFLSYEKFIEVLRETEMDYEFFCTLRDRMKSIPDEFEVFGCEVCKGKHLKALCPKLHYIPYHENIIHKYLHNEKTHQNPRAGFERIPKTEKYQSAFYVYRKSIENVQKLDNLLQSRRRRRCSSKGFCSEADESQNQIGRSFTEVEKELNAIKQQYRNVTMQFLKQQITKLMKTDNLQDEVWVLKSDMLYNYNAYFPECNPSNISTKHIQLNEVSKTENIVKTHTSVMIQHIKNSRHTNKKWSTRKHFRDSNLSKTG